MSTDATNAVITEWRDLTPELAILRVRPDAGKVPSFKPGQFVTLGLPVDPNNSAPVAADGTRQRIRMTRRSYSIASSARHLDDVELVIVLVPPGKLTPQLWAMKRGGRVFLEAFAAGDFTLDPVREHTDLVMIATGTGLAPYVSMLRTRRDDPAAVKPWRRFVLIHGTRLAADLAYREELELLARQDSSFVYLPTVTREPASSSVANNGGWTGHRGRVTALLDPATLKAAAGVDLDPATCHVFLCGNPAMIDEAKAMLEARGFVTHSRVQQGNLHYERYW